MTRLIAVLAILATTGLGASSSWAQMLDPLMWGRNEVPYALEGAYRANAANGEVAFLALASPQGCNNPQLDFDDTDCPLPLRVYFYDQSCTVVDSVEVKLSENDSDLILINAVSSNPQGNVLVSSASPAEPEVPILNPGDDTQVVGALFLLDVNRGIARVETMAGLRNRGWSPYYPAAAIPFLPPSDQVNFFVSLLLRCPVGLAFVNSALNDDLFGDPTTLGGHMLDLASQENAGANSRQAYSATTSTADPEDLCDDCVDDSSFATAVEITIYDRDENLLTTDTVSCECLTEVILSSTQDTYQEFRGLAPTNAWSGFNDGIFTGSYGIQAVGVANGIPINVFFQSRLHQAKSQTHLDP